MPNISWNEVRDRAIRFARDWQDARREAADKQTFWNEFFAVFGRERRTVASFEVAVRNIQGQYNHIDLLWRGMLLVEHKSAGHNLAVAESQAFDYIADLAREQRFDDIPRFVIVSDFARFALYDLEPDAQRALPLFEGLNYAVTNFPLEDLHRYVRQFAFVKGEQTVRIDPEDPANEDAYDLMCQLHDELERGGFRGADLERFLVRVLFCLFAEDTGVFEPNGFQNFIRLHTRDDGADLGPRLNQLFDILNSPVENRPDNLGEELAAFPYVNGALFAERLGFPNFNRAMRERLLETADFQWAKVSPAVFGSLFQGISEDAQRRQQGAHYTSERDILKLIRALFLDDLRVEFERVRQDRSNRRRANLLAFHDRLRALRVLDPACGCGNFLVLAYRELRALELDLLRELHAAQQLLDVHGAIRVDVDQFYGIELAEWPCRIAEVALWLMDHQMNLRVSEAFGERFERLPLRATPHIKTGNALRMDWQNILPPTQSCYVLGNPPFVGKKEQDDDQKADMATIWRGVRGAGNLDYVTCWYRKAVDYIAHEPQIRCAFVSTNSISQGEQVGVLWDTLFASRVKIQFAHRTFNWTSEARGRAHVHVVIIGFGLGEVAEKRIYEYVHPDADPTSTSVTNINPYLVEGGDTTLRTRTRPINGGPEMNYGSMMIDKDRSAGDEVGLILTAEHRLALLEESPDLAPLIRRLYGGKEFLNGIERWCLWLVDARPDLLRSSALLRARIQTVRDFRMNSGREQTRALAATPTLFGEIRQPTTDYLLIPKVSSETRTYIPIGFMTPNEIASGSALIVPGATNYHFGVLSSAMHNAWTRSVAGRMKSDLQYSSNIVYNNFPWPPEVTDRQRAAVSAAAQAVLDARNEHPDATLADLYDPLMTPANLARAHADLDRVVDRCYRAQAFRTDRERVEHLLALYEQLAAPLIRAGQPRRGRRRAQAV